LRVALGVWLRGGFNAQKQPRLSFYADALLDVAQAPVKIKPGDFALRHCRLALEVQVLHDALAGVAFVARQRHQKFHRGLRGHVAIAYRCLRQVRQQVHQGQAPANPTSRAA
jgi:hypothetical protein